MPLTNSERSKYTSRKEFVAFLSHFPHTTPIDDALKIPMSLGTGVSLMDKLVNHLVLAIAPLYLA